LRGHWVPRSRLTRPFDRTWRCLSVHRPPQACASGFILPRASRLLQSTAPDDLPCVPRKTFRPSGGHRAPPMGFRPSSRRQLAASTHARGIPAPSYGPSSTFLTSSTVCSASSLRGFVSPRCRVQGLPSRGLSLAAEPCRVSPAESCPLAVERRLPAVLPAPAAAPSTSGLCSPRRVRCRPDPVKVPSDPRPSWASPLPGTPSTHRGHGFPCPPPTTFARDEPTAVGPRRFAGARHGSPGTRQPTRMRFLA